MAAKSFLCAAAVSFVATVFAADGNALPVHAPRMARTAEAAIHVTDHRHRHHRGSGLFSNWCAYNCYAVPRHAHGCFGKYGYSSFAYDQDIPFRYRWDWDASPLDNALASTFFSADRPMAPFEHIY
ncbi:MAG: hypothetical protein WBX25_26485 [Rhodomicrobium sp.]